MKKLKYIIVPLLIGMVFAFSLNRYLEYENVKMLNQKDIYPVLHDPQSLIKDKGVFVNDYLTRDKGYILLMGSSELSHSTTQHPDYYFDTGRTKYGVITAGRAYTQTLQHASILGSLSDIKDRKVVLILSMQWFMEKEGVTPHHFQTRFSPIQFYRFMKNPEISRDVKKYYAGRIYTLLDGSSDFASERLYAKLYEESNTWYGKTAMYLMDPYFRFREAMVSLKDKGISYNKLEQQFSRNYRNHDIKGKIDWKKEKDTALKEAQVRVGNRPQTIGNERIYVDKGYYREYIKTKKKYMKDMYSYVRLDDSKEFQDFDMFLKICKETGVKPTIVLVPGMKAFYDYTGIDEKERNMFNRKISQEVKDYHFRLIDLTKHENDKYYLRDVMHIGTVGWVDLCQKLYDIYER